MKEIFKSSNCDWWKNDLQRINTEYGQIAKNLVNVDAIIKSALMIFNVFKKPINILNESANLKNVVYQEIVHDYSNLKPDKMNYHDSEMMILDSDLLNDSAIFYFLPRLAIAVFNEGGCEDLLMSRLKSCNKSKLTEHQINIIQEIEICLEELIKVYEILEKEQGISNP
jgi:hypothetical protein